MNQCDVIDLTRPQAEGVRSAELPSRSARAALPFSVADFDVVEGVSASSVALRWRTLLVHHLRRGVGAGEELAVSVAFLNAASFRARIRSGWFGPLRYCHLEADARDSRIACLARPDSGRQLVILQLSGTSRIAADARMVRLRPNEVLVVDQLDAIRMEDEGRVEQLLLVLERHEVAVCLPRGLRTLQPDGARSTMLFGSIRDCSLAADAPPSGVSGGIAHVHGENRLSDPCLSPSRVNHAIGRSVPSLHGAFGRPGTPSRGHRGTSTERIEGELARAA
jgi:hypothetical protein